MNKTRMFDLLAASLIAVGLIVAMIFWNDDGLRSVGTGVMAVGGFMVAYVRRRRAPR